MKAPSEKRILEIYGLLEDDDTLSNFVMGKMEDTMRIQVEVGMSKEDGRKLAQGVFWVVEKVAKQEAQAGGKFTNEEILSRLKTASIEFQRLKTDGQYLQ